MKKRTKPTKPQFTAWLILVALVLGASNKITGQTRAGQISYQISIDYIWAQGLSDSEDGVVIRFFKNNGTPSILLSHLPSQGYYQEDKNQIKLKANKRYSRNWILYEKETLDYGETASYQIELLEQEGRTLGIGNKDFKMGGVSLEIENKYGYLLTEWVEDLKIKSKNGDIETEYQRSMSPTNDAPVLLMKRRKGTENYTYFVKFRVSNIIWKRRSSIPVDAKLQDHGGAIEGQKRNGESLFLIRNESNPGKIIDHMMLGWAQNSAPAKYPNYRDVLFRLLQWPINRNAVFYQYYHTGGVWKPLINGAPPNYAAHVGFQYKNENYAPVAALKADYGQGTYLGTVFLNGGVRENQGFIVVDNESRARQVQEFQVLCEKDYDIIE